MENLTAKHTPGTIVDGICTYCGRDYRSSDELCNLKQGYCPSDDCPSHELFAAAPELLEALEGIVKSITATQSEYLHGMVYMDAARAAIAKAKGE